MARNYWTNAALLNDHHLGSAREAALIAAENGTDAPMICTRCGGEAHYRDTILTEQCINCGAKNFRHSARKDQHGQWSDFR